MISLSATRSLQIQTHQKSWGGLLSINALLKQLMRTISDFAARAVQSGFVPMAFPLTPFSAAGGISGCSCAFSLAESGYEVDTSKLC